MITPHIGGSTADIWFSTQKRVIDGPLKNAKKKNYMKKFLFVELMDIGLAIVRIIRERISVTAIDNFSKRKIENENNIKPLNPTRR